MLDFPTAFATIFSDTPMQDDELLRYSRQIMLPGIDIEGQERLLDSRVLIVGQGGLGSPVAMYLAGSGVGHLVLVDDDTVDLSNLQRQIIHTTARVGEPKTDSARASLEALNPLIRVDTIAERLTGDALRNEVSAADLVVECTDSFESRFEVNRACVQTRTTLVSGAAIRMEGQVTVFALDTDDSPCYRCVYPDTGELGERCADTGVLGSMVGIIGCVQATEAIKVLTGFGESLAGRLLMLDARQMRFSEFRLSRDPECPVCSG